MANEERMEKEIEVNSKSLEDALRGCRADLDIWEVERYAVEENTKGYNYKITFNVNILFIIFAESPFPST